jgi:hypothetical protein
MLLAACANNATLPTPNTPKTAGVEALVAYGLVGTVSHDYLSLPWCTKPPTALCKTPDIAAKVLALDTKAHDAAVAADNAANADPVKNAIANTAIDDLKKANQEANGGKQ